jgi:hypothetical protein
MRKRRRAPTPPEQLDALSRYSESDKQRVKLAAEEQGSPKLVALLNAEPLRGKPAGRQAGELRDNRVHGACIGGSAGY